MAAESLPHGPMEPQPQLTTFQRLNIRMAESEARQASIGPDQLADIYQIPTALNLDAAPAEVEPVRLNDDKISVRVATATVSGIDYTRDKLARVADRIENFAERAQTHPTLKETAANKLESSKESILKVGSATVESVGSRLKTTETYADAGFANAKEYGSEQVSRFKNFIKDKAKSAFTRSVNFVTNAKSKKDQFDVVAANKIESAYNKTALVAKRTVLAAQIGRGVIGYKALERVEPLLDYRDAIPGRVKDAVIDTAQRTVDKTKDAFYGARAAGVEKRADMLVASAERARKRQERINAKPAKKMAKADELLDRAYSLRRK